MSEVWRARGCSRYANGAWPERPAPQGQERGNMSEVWRA